MDGEFQCNTCNETRRHRHAANGRMLLSRFECEHCEQWFTSRQAVNRHTRVIHNQRLNVVSVCTICNEALPNTTALHRHVNQHLPVNNMFVLRQHAFEGVTMKYVCNFEQQNYAPVFVTVSDAMRYMWNDAIELLQFHTARLHQLKASASLKVLFRRGNELNPEEGNVLEQRQESLIFHLHGSTSMLLTREDARPFLEECATSFEMQIEGKHEMGSNLILDRVLSFNCHLTEVQLRYGSCDAALISLVSMHQITTSKAYVNRSANSKKLKDCFLLAVAAALQSDRMMQNDEAFLRAYYRQHFNLEGINLPFAMSQIDKFERQNRHLAKNGEQLHINVYGIEKNSRKVAKTDGLYAVYVVRKAQGELLWKQKHIINLVLIHCIVLMTKEEKKCFTSPMNESKREWHYANIIDLMRFMAPYYPEHKSREHHSIPCTNCLEAIYIKRIKGEKKDKRAKRLQLRLENHQVECGKHPATRVRLPTEETKWFKFKKSLRKTRLPYIVFYDFETVELNRTGETLHPEREALHDPVMYCIVIVNTQGKVVLRHTYHGSDCIENFWVTMLTLEKSMILNMQRYRDLKISKEERSELFDNWDGLCYICENKPMDDVGPVIDHCHYSDTILGIACARCNLGRRVIELIPVYAHNANVSKKDWILITPIDDVLFFRNSIYAS